MAFSRLRDYLPTTQSIFQNVNKQTRDLAFPPNTKEILDTFVINYWQIFYRIEDISGKIKQNTHTLNSVIYNNVFVPQIQEAALCVMPHTHSQVPIHRYCNESHPYLLECLNKFPSIGTCFELVNQAFKHTTSCASTIDIRASCKAPISNMLPLYIGMFRSSLIGNFRKGNILVASMRVQASA